MQLPLGCLVVCLIYGIFSRLVLADVTEPNCADKEDGFYEMGCSSRFYSCSGHILKYMDCPQDLVFDKKKNWCLYRDGASACETVKRKRSLTADKTICLTQKSGDYPISACSPRYLHCDNKLGYVFSCATDLVFDRVTSKCLEHKTVNACRTAQSLKFDAEKIQKMAARGEGICRDHIHETLTLGECSSVYFACEGGRAHRFDCPAGTVFDVQRGLCNYRSEVSGCLTPPPVLKISVQTTPSTLANAEQLVTPAASSGTLVPNKKVSLEVMAEVKVKLPKQEVTTPLVIPEGSTAQSVTQPGLPLQVAQGNLQSVVEAKDEGSCDFEGRKYEIGSSCTNYYLQCIRGLLRMKHCPPGTYYNSYTQNCTTNPSCDAKQPVQVAVSTAPLLSPSPAPALPIVTTALHGVQLHSEPVAVKTECVSGERKAIGSCSSSYLSCTDQGRYLTLMCNPETLMFDPVLKLCQRRELILDCDDNVVPLTGSIGNVPLVTENIVPIKTTVVASPSSAVLTPKKSAKTGVLSVTTSPILPSSQYVLDRFAIPTVADGYVNIRTPLVQGLRGLPMSPMTPFMSAIPDLPVGTSLQEDPLSGLSGLGNDNTPGETRLFVSRKKRAIDDSSESFKNRCNGVEQNTSMSIGFCRNDYVVCHPRPGTWYEMRNCLTGQVYDTITKQCLLDPACVTPKANTNINCPLTLVNSSLAYPGCREIFLICTNGVGWIMQCPRGLLYDKFKNRCDYAFEVEECHGIKPLAAYGIDFNQILGARTPREASQDSKEETTKLTSKEALTTTTAPSASRANQPSSLAYLEKCGSDAQWDATQCADRYYSCRYKREIMCRPNTLFDIGSARCIDEKQCNRSSLTTSEQPKSKILRSGSDGFCANKENGMYTDPDNKRRHIDCYGNEAYKSRHECQSGFEFDEIAGSCQYKAPSESDSDKKRCEGKKNGSFVAEKCSRKYYRCVDGWPVDMECPGNTRFDNDWNLCNFKDNIEECKN